MSYRLGVLVPTSDRPHLCIRAVSAIRAVHSSRTSVTISDNSRDSRSRAAIEQFAASAPDVRLIRPTTFLPMRDHWNWAIDTMLSDSSLTHLTILTDRMVFRSTALALLEDVAARFPHDIISYNHDRLDDWNPQRISFVLNRGSGRLFKVDSTLLLRRTAAGDAFLWPLPRLLNSVAPREIVQAVR